MTWRPYAAGVALSAAVFVTGVLWHERHNPHIAAEDIAALAADARERASVFGQCQTNALLPAGIGIGPARRLSDVQSVAALLRQAVFLNMPLYNATQYDQGKLYGGYCVRLPADIDDGQGAVALGVYGDAVLHATWPPYGVAYEVVYCVDGGGVTFTPRLWFSSHRWQSPVNGATFAWAAGASATIDSPAYLSVVGPYWSKHGRRYEITWVPPPPVPHGPPAGLSADEEAAGDWWAYRLSKVDSNGIHYAISGLCPTFETTPIDRESGKYVRPWPYFGVPEGADLYGDAEYDRRAIATNTLNDFRSVITGLTTTVYFLPHLYWPPYASFTNHTDRTGYSRVSMSPLSPPPGWRTRDMPLGEALASIQGPVDVSQADSAFADKINEIGADPEPAETWPFLSHQIISAYAYSTWGRYFTEWSMGEDYYGNTDYLMEGMEGGEALQEWASREFQGITLDVVPPAMYASGMVSRVRCYAVFEVVPRVYQNEWNAIPHTISAQTPGLTIDVRSDLGQGVSGFRFSGSSRAGEVAWRPDAEDTDILKYWTPVITNLVGSLVYDEQFPTAPPTFDIVPDMSLCKEGIAQLMAGWTETNWVDVSESEDTYYLNTDDGWSGAEITTGWLAYRVYRYTSVGVFLHGFVVAIDWNFTDYSAGGTGGPYTPPWAANAPPATP